LLNVDSLYFIVKFESIETFFFVKPRTQNTRVPLAFDHTRKMTNILRFVNLASTIKILRRSWWCITVHFLQELPRRRITWGKLRDTNCVRESRNLRWNKSGNFSTVFFAMLLYLMLFHSWVFSCTFQRKSSEAFVSYQKYNVKTRDSRIKQWFSTLKAWRPTKDKYDHFCGPSLSFWKFFCLFYAFHGAKIVLSWCLYC